MAQIGKEVYKQRAMSTDDLSPLNSFKRRDSSGIYDQDTSIPFGGGGQNNMQRAKSVADDSSQYLRPPSQTKKKYWNDIEAI